MSNIAFGVIKDGMFYEGHLDAYGNQQFSENGVSCQLPAEPIVKIEASKIESDCTWRGWLKCRGASNYLRQVAIMANCFINVDVDKHWFSETAFFTVTGKQSNVDWMQNQINSDIDAFNNR